MTLEKTGLIFDIKRFAIHDGDGLRSTIFFKGCNLNCVWCQNPEGISLKQQAIKNQSKCINCLLCTNLAKKNTNISNEKSPVNIKEINKLDLEKIKQIVDECPTESLKLNSKTYTVDEIVKEILKDEVFFKYGGGVTFSGGEPLLQVDFIVEVLKKLKKRNIHTAIETALNVNVETLKKVVPYLDLIYADIKVFDNEKHKKITGSSNKKILENVKYLLTSSYKQTVIIRTPMIPGFSDSIQNIMGISNYISKIYDQVNYEILNYNPLAKSKYNLVEKDYCFTDNPTKFTENQMDNFRKIAIKNGIKNIIK